MSKHMFKNMSEHIGFGGRVDGFFSLPKSTLRRAARHGGVHYLPGVQYTRQPNIRPRRTAQTAWRATTEAATTVAQVALSTRMSTRTCLWYMSMPGGAVDPTVL